MNHEGTFPVIPGKLYFLPVTTIALRKHPSYIYFSIDDELVYWNFFLDFGPLNLGQLYRFCSALNRKFESTDDNCTVPIVFYSGPSREKITNAIYLIMSYLILYKNWTPEEVYLEYKALITNYSLPFHDASNTICTYDLSVLDCLRGLAKARVYRFFDFTTFNVAEYEHFEAVENGDLNWIVDNKFLAFAGPHYRKEISREGYIMLTPDDYIPYFLEKKVKLVVRLNKKNYDESLFKKAGIAHVEHYYLDGSCPPMSILQSVLRDFEKVALNGIGGGGAVAVHCKAGLGRTGTCIGAFLMKHYKFTASEVIGWMRICRPGCVIGPQQHFMREIEQQMWHEGDVLRLKYQLDEEKKINHVFERLSIEEDEGDEDLERTGLEIKGQGESLVSRRAQRQRSSQQQSVSEVNS